MKLSQLIESFVISNDEFEDYLNRATEQLAQELQSGKNARDAIHDLSLTFADQHNKAYDAYVRMQDALTARMHTLELDAASAGPADMMNEPMADMGDEMGSEMEPDMGGEPEMMTDPMGDMEMSTPADSEMPSDSDMDDYAAVMDNEPEAEEVEESVNESSCGCCGNNPCDCDDDCDCKKVNEAEEKPYICVHAKKGKHECHAKSSYAAAQKAAEHWKLKSTAGIDAHLAVEEGTKQRLDPKCWDGYKKQGTKMKGGKRVNNCVPESVNEAEGDTYAKIAYDYSESWYGIELYKDGQKVEDYDDYIGANEEGNPLTAKFVELCKKHGMNPVEVKIIDSDDGGSGKFDGKSFKWDESVNESMETINRIVADKQAQKIHGMLVDGFTASAIKQIYDAVNDENKAKLDDLMSSKEGVVKTAQIAMKMMKEGYEGDINEAGPLALLAPLAGAALRAAPAVSKVAKGLGKAAAVGKAVGGAVKKVAGVGSAMMNRASTGYGSRNPVESADRIMRTSTRASFSEYNEFYKALDTAAKQGKKAGDTIEVGGKKIKLKSNPKQMHQLSDAEMDKIDALAQRLEEKGCSSKMKK